MLPFTDIFTSGSLVLAMSFKKAVIIPRLGCVIDYLEQQDLRLSYSVDEPDGLPHTMQYANTLDRSYIQQVGIVNYNKAKSFDWDTIARDTLSVYMK